MNETPLQDGDFAAFHTLKARSEAIDWAIAHGFKVNEVTLYFKDNLEDFRKYPFVLFSHGEISATCGEIEFLKNQVLPAQFMKRIKAGRKTTKTIQIGDGKIR